MNKEEASILLLVEGISPIMSGIAKLGEKKVDFIVQDGNLRTEGKPSKDMMNAIIEALSMKKVKCNPAFSMGNA